MYLCAYMYACFWVVYVSVCVCVCVCVCRSVSMHVYVQVPTEARGRCLKSSSGFVPPHSFKTVYLQPRVGGHSWFAEWPHALPSKARTSDTQPGPRAFGSVHDIWTRVPVLESKHFNHWAISPACKYLKSAILFFCPDGVIGYGLWWPPSNLHYSIAASRPKSRISFIIPIFEILVKI
jgi:hypothetical protein